MTFGDIYVHTHMCIVMRICVCVYFFILWLLLGISYFCTCCKQKYRLPIEPDYLFKDIYIEKDRKIAMLVFKCLEDSNVSFYQRVVMFSASYVSSLNSALLFCNVSQYMYRCQLACGN